MSRSKGKGNPAKRINRRHATLEEHKRTGKVLSSPFSQLGLTKLSWMNDRLPEMLWALLILDSCGREAGLDLFRRVVAWARAQKPDSQGQPIGISLSQIASLPCETRRGLIALISSTQATRDALCPLLLFPDIPASTEWAEAIEQSPLSPSWEAVTRAVGGALWHQSESSTDCRWLRVLNLMAQGKLLFPPTMAETAQNIWEYPRRGDLRAVRPSIRAAETMLDLPRTGEELQPPPEWPSKFWQFSLAATPCLRSDQPPLDPTQPLSRAASRLEWIRERVLLHEANSRVHSAMDARRESVFGFVLYGLQVADEIIAQNKEAVVGRAGLRTLAESYIAFAFLLTEDDPSMWLKYRAYGVGQAKLNFLKMQESPPAYVSLETLEGLANEDMWQDFVDIDVGNGAGLDLRRMSEQAKVKDVYDQYYAWPSNYVHGQWAAIREVCFEICLNPLHRLHRIPRAKTARLSDVTGDALVLLDRTLSLLDVAYPGCGARFVEA